MATTKAVKQLFKKMHAYYGSKWLAMWPTVDLMKSAVNVWDEDLKHFTDEDLAHGLMQCRNPTGKHVIYPPTFFEFEALCRMGRRTNIKNNICFKCGMNADLLMPFKDGVAFYFCEKHYLEISKPELFKMIYESRNDECAA